MNKNNLAKRESYLADLKKYLNTTINFPVVDEKSTKLLNGMAERSLDDYIHLRENSTDDDLLEFLDHLSRTIKEMYIRRHNPLSKGLREYLAAHGFKEEEA